MAVYTNTTTITLDSATVATTDYYNDMLIVFSHGTGAGQVREIKDYTSGRVVTMSPALITALDTTTTYTITGTISADEISDEIWDELRSGHTTDGSMGQVMRKAVDIDVDDTTAANVGSAYGQVDDIQTDTAEIGTAGAGLTDLGGMSSGMQAEVNTEVDTAFTTQMADSVPADGTIATREEAMYMMLQLLSDFSISGTTMTVRKVDGSTTLITLTLDDDTNPTDITRAT